MKTHISIFAFLLGAFAVGLVGSVFADTQPGVQTIYGGYYYFSGTYQKCDYAYMSCDGQPYITLLDGTEATFKANPPAGMKVSNWRQCLGATAWDDVMHVEDWDSGRSEETYPVKGDSTKGDAYLAVNFTYLPLEVKTNNAVFVTGDITNEMTLPTCEKTGYTGAWTNEKGVRFEFGQECSGLDFWDKDDKRFYADLRSVWTAKDYAVTSAGAYCTVSSQASADYNGDLVISWTPVGGDWKTPTVVVYAGTDDTGPELARFTSGTSATFNMEKAGKGYCETIFIKASYDVHTLTFDANGGACDETSRLVESGTLIGELPRAKQVKSTQTGWWDDPDPEAGNKITAATVYAWPGDITAYAHWKAADLYEIATIADPEAGGVLEGGGNDFEKDEETTLRAKENEGYGFVKWTAKTSGEERADPEWTITVVGNEQYTAFFTGNVYKVSFDWDDDNGEGWLPSSMMVTFGQPYGMADAIPADPDYAFDYWLDGKGNKITAETAVAISERHTLYAHVTLRPAYTIRYIGNGATNEALMANQKAYCGEDVALAPNRYGRTGYVFNCWTNSVGTSYTNGQIVCDLANTNETATLYATWSPIAYTLAFDAQDGDFGQALEPMTCTYGKEYGVQYTKGTKALFDFGGWSNAWNGAVYSAANGFRVKDAYEVPDGTNTLIAIWNSQLTEYSRAMHCTNLVWNPTGPSWVCVNDPSAGYGPSGSCVRGKYGDGLATSVLATGGMLSFRWKADMTGEYATLAVYVNGTKTPLIPRDTEWQLAEVPVPAGLGADSVTIKLTLEWETDCSVDVDQMTWTPKALHPVPDPEKDFVTISSAAVSDGKFTLSFDSKAEFDYNLLTNANLLIKEGWGVMTNEVGTGKPITFEPEIIEGQPQMFYRVDTIRKKD